MNELITVTVEWATNTDVPNALLVIALLTSPATWSERISGRFGTALDRIMPGETATNGGTQ